MCVCFNQVNTHFPDITKQTRDRKRLKIIHFFLVPDTVSVQTWTLVFGCFAATDWSGVCLLLLNVQRVELYLSVSIPLCAIALTACCQMEWVLLGGRCRWGLALNKNESWCVQQQQQQHWGDETIMRHCHVTGLYQCTGICCVAHVAPHSLTAHTHTHAPPCPPTPGKSAQARPGSQSDVRISVGGTMSKSKPARQRRIKIHPGLKLQPEYWSDDSLCPAARWQRKEKVCVYSKQPRSLL